MNNLCLPEWRDKCVAVVGYGSIGRRHAENLRRLGVGRVILIRRSSGSNTAFQPPADILVVHDAHEAMQLGVAAAIVCTPTSRHFEDAAPFLTAGTAVLMEKPISADLATGRRLEKLAHKHRNVCGVAYCMRYHPAYQLARAAIHDGTLGRIAYAKTWFESWLPNWHPWEDYRQSYAARKELGGGALPTLDHEIDFLNWCLGQPRQAGGETYASGLLEMNADDVALLNIEYSGGVRASCLLSLCRRDRQRGFEFIGSQGSLRYSLETAQLLLCRDEQVPRVVWDGANYDANEMYRDMLADFLNAVTTTGMPPVTLDAGVAALEVCASLSSRSAQ